MALGGGTFVTQNKVIPGAYINFVSAARAQAVLGERGVATMPLELDWGPEGEVFEISATDFEDKCLSLFGYPSTHKKMTGVRDVLKNARLLYAYRLNGGGESAKKASGTYAEAKYAGTRGNDIKIVIEQNVDFPEKFNVLTYLDGSVVDEQTAVSTADELKENDFVTFKAAELAQTAGDALKGGANGTVTGTEHDAYRKAISGYAFNTMGVAIEDEPTKAAYASFCRRMRDELGVKFQLVLHSHKADYIGVINVKNEAALTDGFTKEALVYWVTGAEAGCAVNASCQNKVYDGEFSVKSDYGQEELKAAISAGEFTLHRVGAETRVLLDINSKTSVTATEGEDFKSNQIVRVIDQIGNDIAAIFNTRYNGIAPNDDAGRTSLWGDVVKHFEQLRDIRAIDGFADSDVTVSQGESKTSVVVTSAVSPVSAMAVLYMTVTVA